MADSQQDYLDKLLDIAKDAAPYVAAGVMMFAAVEIGGAAAAAGGKLATSNMLIGARSFITDTAASWAAKDLPAQIMPAVRSIISEYGAPAAKQVLKDLGGSDLSQISAQQLKEAVIKRFGPAGEKAIYNKGRSLFTSYLDTIKNKNATTQFIFNNAFRKDQLDDITRRIGFYGRSGEIPFGVSSRNPVQDFRYQALKKVRQTSNVLYKYGIEPSTPLQRFTNAFAKGATRQYGGLSARDLLTLIPGRKAPFIRKAYRDYRRYVSKRILFGATAKTRGELLSDFVGFLAKQQYFSYEIAGQVSGHLVGGYAYQETRRAIDRQLGTKSAYSKPSKRKKKGGMQHVRSYYRNGYIVKAYDRRVAA
jgi:hypothetical protein